MSVVVNLGNPAVVGIMRFQYIFTLWFGIAVFTKFSSSPFLLSALVYCRFLFFLGVQRIPVLRTLLVELHTTEILGIWMQVT
jgi:hypothetical protein